MTKPDTEPPAALPLLDTEILRTLVAIAETGSFSRAAKQVFRTPSAVSMQIKRLETQLRQTLFLRDARHVTLTPEGEVLLGYARRLLQLNEEAVTHFLAPTLEGTVRLGTPDDVATRILPGVLAQFGHSHPAVQVDVVVGRSVDMMAQLEAGELDLALATTGNDGDALIRGKAARGKTTRSEVVHTEPLVWACREDGIAATHTPLPLALASQTCAWRATALAALDRAGLPYRIAFISEHCAGQEAALLADLAVAPFPRSLLRKPLAEAATDLPPLGDYRIVMAQRPRPGKAADALAGYLRQGFRQHRG